MPDALTSLLLMAALVVAYMQHARTAEPTLTICQHCGDAVYAPPGWPQRCPTCRAWFIS